MTEHIENPEENTTNTQPTPPPSPYENESKTKEYITIPAGTVAPQAPPAPQPPYPPAQTAPPTFGQPNMTPGGQTPPPPGYAYPPQPGYQYPPQGHGVPQQHYPPQGYYYAQPPYPPQAPQKKRVWPWVLTICLLIGFLGIGGCVSCTFITAAILDDYPSYPYDYDYDYGYPYNYDFDEDILDELDGLFSDDWSGPSSTVTLSDLEDLVKDKPSTVKDRESSICSTGIFEVGSDKDIDPGLYYLEGSQTEEGSFSVYEKLGKDEYALAVPVAYFGNYYVDLKADDVILFFGPEDATMYPAKDAPKVTESPLKSGCYLVGTDIDPGTYKVTYQKGLPEDSSQAAGVYIMKDVKWEDDSITESYALIAGGSHTITVKSGEYVELYGATMTLEEK